MSIVADTATLARGYSMGDVDRAARMAASKAHASPHMSWTERNEVAWMAIVEAVYDGSEIGSLVKIGLQAISTESNAYLRQHGLRGDRGDDEFSCKFSIFWRHIGAGGDRDFTDSVTERLALPMVLGTLTPAEYEAVVALAAHGSSTAAAEALGIKLGAFSSRMRTARKRMLEAWYSPETPPDTTQGKLSLDGECNSGHDMTVHGVIYDGRPRCRMCKRNNQRRVRARAA